MRKATLHIIFLVTVASSTYSQNVIIEEIDLSELTTIQSKFGSDSVYEWIGGLPIWLLNDSIATELALNDTTNSDRSKYFLTKLGQNVDEERLALKLEHRYKEWLMTIKDTEIDKQLIPVQDDRLILALCNQSSLERKTDLLNELNTLQQIKDSINVNQPGAIRKFFMFFKGWNEVVENKYRIELTILKTYYQLNKIDSIQYPHSLVTGQFDKIEKWRDGYDIERFNDVTTAYKVDTLDLQATNISEIDIKQIRDIQSFSEPQVGTRKWITKITSGNRMIVSYGMQCGRSCGWGETLLIKITEAGKIQCGTLSQWIS